MKKSLLFFIALLLVISLLNNTQVQCWSKQQKDKAADESKRGEKAKQRSQRSIEDIQKEIDRLDKVLEVEINEEHGIPQAKLNELNTEIEKIQVFIDEEKNEDKKKYFQDEKDQKLKEIEAKIVEEKRRFDAQTRRRQRLQNEINEAQNGTQQEKQEQEQESKKQREEQIKKNHGNKNQNGDENSSKEDEHIEIEEDVKADESMADWLKQWEEEMEGFKADEMLSFEVPAKGYEVFLEDVKGPCTIRGAFFINFDSKDGIELKIMDPDNKEVEKLVGKKQGIFKFEAQVAGTYSFYFQNRRSKNKKQVSFAVDVSESEFLQKEDIDQITQEFRDIFKGVKSQLSQFKTLRRKNRAVDQNRESNATKVFVFTVLETIFIIGCTLFQVIYIKRILDHKSFV
ncbi:hypothetical protein PPERSA_05871 [Pseudocohnilembus persalinus]|uniref:GOLD domain-containing protein n=1 Tax=Pseudocohnilembus persalinus TaxID=266149 RepID=A0A0V0R401_PSEPJ|nr:hypothetical protein PPERSA_05871 [Pseudocohnilembus persalinus]|eukprot:KRX09202.1 hypothetical protein PPERSA_05871 [Pseudocohnilembus persalinus]